MNRTPAPSIDAYAPVDSRYIARYITRRDALRKARVHATYPTLLAGALALVALNAGAPLLTVSAVLMSVLAATSWLGVGRHRINLLLAGSRIDSWLAEKAGMSADARRQFMAEVKPEYTFGARSVRFVTRDQSGYAFGQALLAGEDGQVEVMSAWAASA